MFYRLKLELRKMNEHRKCVPKALTVYSSQIMRVNRMTPCCARSMFVCVYTQV